MNGRSPRTSASLALGLDLQTALMNEVQGLDGVAPIDDARDVDLVRALAYHLDIDVALAERGEHPSRYADHVAHRLSHQRQNGHVADHCDLAARAVSTSVAEIIAMHALFRR